MTVTKQCQGARDYRIFRLITIHEIEELLIIENICKFCHHSISFMLIIAFTKNDLLVTHKLYGEMYIFVCLIKEFNKAY